MAKYTKTIDADVLAVLNRSDITATGVILPQQLDRPLYERVDKVLRTAGGKWNRSAKAHVFKADPREVLGLALAAGEITDEAKRLQQFFTPDDLALQVVGRLGILPGMTVLEPSAGGGALARAAEAMGGSVTCYELDARLAAGLLEQGFRTLNVDFLQAVPHPFDRIAMNPPFAEGRDIEHVWRALTSFLKPGGVLVAIMPSSVKFGDTLRQRNFRAYLDNMGGSIEDLPGGSFSESGTEVNTVLVHAILPKH